jgi:chaperonin GroEL
MMKEAAERTAASAGDGTTTAIVLTEALVMGGLEYITDGHNRTAVLRHLVELGDKVVERLKQKSCSLTDSMLLDVATISCNNDRAMGSIISDVYHAVGLNGLVTVERSQSSETYTETTKGLKFDRGYSSNLFINNQKRDECIFEDVMVLVADIEISNILQIESILKPIITENKRLLIIAPCSNNVINTLAANVVKGNVKVCSVIPPNFGYKQHELMQDIAMSVGATYFSEKTGDDLSLLHYGNLGHAQKVIVSSDKTVILKSPYRSNEEAISERVSQLWAAHELTKSKVDRDFILERIASLTGGVGVIYVGGNTDLEQKELFDRVDDAVCAVRSALEEGIVPGAGKALYEIDLSDLEDKSTDKNYVAALDILRMALESPLVQILENAGLCSTDIYGGRVADGDGYNLKDGKMGNLIEMGVVDPLKVTRCALQNAISVASTILSTNAIVTMARTYESTSNPV